MKKRAVSDFTSKELPQNRKDQFFFIFRNQYWNLLKIGGISLLFALPYIFLSLAKDILNYEFLNLMNQGQLEEAEYHTYFLLNTVGANLLGYLFLPLLALGLSGINRVLRSLVEGECVLFKDDFRLGAKNNYARTLQGLLLFSFVFFLHQFLITYFQSPILIVPSFLVLILLLAPVSFIYFAYSSHYEGSFWNCLTNSVKLYPPFWWQFLLLGAAFVASFYGLDSIPSYYVKGIALLLMVLLLFPVYGLLFFEVAISDFDSSINATNFPSRLGQGLYRPETKTEKEMRKKAKGRRKR